jgi:catechol 2,3-dioxygenase-like lactoylglutathione lyase family enzyme
MIGYVTIGTNDLVRAAAFYDALLGELGAKRMMETDQFIAWSVRPDAPGPRGEGGFYAGYFRDLNGNKLNFFHFGQS